MEKLTPVHPGEILKKDFMVPSGLSANALAMAIGVTAARVNEIVRGRRGISAGTALRLARYFGTDAQSWMNMQHQFELEMAEQRIGDQLDNIRPIKENV
jgi:addiction module HigA family antidote